MIRLWARLTTVRSPDEDVQRRAGTLVTIALALIVVPMLFIPLFISSPNGIRAALGIAGMIVFCVVALLLARRGMATIGGLLLIGALIILPLLTVLSFGQIQASAVFFLMAPLVAGVVLRPWQIWIVAMLSTAALVAAALLIPQRPAINSPEWLQIRNAIAMEFIVALVGVAGSRSATAILRQAQEARAATERSAAALEQANAELERRVGERTAALAAALTAQQQQYEELQQSLAAQQQLTALVADLSLPVIPVRDDVLVAPLVGNISNVRTEDLLATVLHQVEIRRARALILDVTGVAVVDTQVGQTLIKMAAAARLLGTQTILVGIRPEVAQTLIGLGIDLGILQTAATLQEGLVSITG
jgi:anti-anti-sigma regulatory factor